MIKKLAVVAGIGIASAAVLTQTKFGSYILTAIDRAEKTMDENVPLDLELDRLRREVTLLDHDIDDLKGKVAKAKVTTQELNDEVATLEKEVEKNQSWLEKKGEEIKAVSTNQKVKWNGLDLSVGEAKERLASEVKQQANRKSELKTKKEMLSIRAKNWQLMERQFAAMKQQKSEMSTELNKLEAEINHLKLVQLESKHQSDDTRIADVKQSVQKMKHKIAVQRETLNLSKQYDENSVADKSVDEILAGLKTASE